jgi:hypothetical protein
LSLRIVALALLAAALSQREVGAQERRDLSTRVAVLVPAVVSLAPLPLPAMRRTGGLAAEATLTATVSANVSHEVRVVLADAPALADGRLRVWVRAPSGDFVRLTAAGALVHVGQPAGRVPVEVAYRLEADDAALLSDPALPFTVHVRSAAGTMSIVAR